MKEIFKKYFFYSALTIIILFGISLRLKNYMLNSSLWHDECSLALSLVHKNFFDLLMQPLEHFQCAPAFFLGLTKIVVTLFGYGELQIRLIPQISSILSVFAFYFLSKLFFKNNKILVFVVTFLFAINYNLILYSQEFKPYSSDVLILICSILLLTKMNFEKNNIKEIFLFSLSSILLMLASFPASFVIAGNFLLSKKRKKDINKCLVYLAPLFLLGIVYYLKVLATNQSIQANTLSYFWQAGFISTNPISFLLVCKNNLNFLFVPNSFPLFGLFLCIIGVSSVIKKWNTLGYLFILTLLLTFLASFFHIYPLSERTALYLLPIVLLLTTNSLININKKQPIISVILIVVFISYFAKYNLGYLHKISSQKIARKEQAREMMQFMRKNIKPNDIIFINNASDSEFDYYSSFSPLKNKTYRETLGETPTDKYLLMLDKLPKKNYYWFYEPFDYSHSRVIPFIVKWGNKEKVIYSIDKGEGRLMYIYVH